MDIKRSKKIHIIVEEEPKRKAAKIPLAEPDPRDEFFKKALAPDTTKKDLETIIKTELERRFAEEKIKRVDEALLQLRLAQRRNKKNDEWMYERVPTIIEIPSFEEIELFKKLPGMPVPKGVSLSDEKLKASMEMMATTTGRFAMNTSAKTLLEREKLSRFEAQLQNARNTPERYWTTGDGRRVMITEMKDEHLINTINYLFNKINRDLALYVSDKYLDLLNRYNVTERSTMNADMFFEEVKRLEGIEGCKLAFKRFPKLKNLLSEAMARGLYWQNYKSNKKGAKK